MPESMMLPTIGTKNASLQTALSDDPRGEPTETISLLLVDRRTIIRGCLSLWISALAPNLEVSGVDDVELLPSNGSLQRVQAVILATSGTDPADDAWLHDQIARVRTQRPEIPIVLIAELQHAVSIGEFARRLSLTGYIPTSSSLGVASAALRLVLAGGKYLPPTNQAAEAPARPLTVKLTPREQVVLDLLEHGLPNKTIGKRLGMSPSTVKAHVHNIISKLNVRNRTEAAVARYINSPGAAAVTPAPEGALADVIRLRR